MRDILDLTVHLRQKSHAHGEEVAKSLGISLHEMPAGVFAMIFNMHTLMLELLSHYFCAWNKATETRCPSIDETRKQNAERVILIQKMIFVQTMSSVEYCCKDYIKSYPQKIGQIKGRIYLSKIIEESKRHNVISDSELTRWKGAIELRNTLVHNNGISEKTAQYSYPRCHLKLTKNKMIRGNLKQFPYITDWLLDATKSWILEMYKKGHEMNGFCLHI